MVAASSAVPVAPVGSGDRPAPTNGGLVRSDGSGSLAPVVNPPTGSGLLPVAENALRPAGGDRHVGWFVGVHGGAGATTCASIMAPFADAGQVIPAADDPAICILVANPHRAGLRAAHRAVLQFGTGAAGAATLAGVVLVSDCPGRVPKALAGDMARLVEAAPGGNVWTIPHIPAWRTVVPDDLPAAWEPSMGGDLTAGGARRRGRRSRVDPLRELPDEVTHVAEEIFTRCKSLFTRINQAG